LGATWRGPIKRDEGVRREDFLEPPQGGVAPRGCDPGKAPCMAGDFLFQLARRRSRLVWGHSIIALAGRRSFGQFVLAQSCFVRYAEIGWRDRRVGALPGRQRLTLCGLSPLAGATTQWQDERVRHSGGCVEKLHHHLPQCGEHRAITADRGAREPGARGKRIRLPSATTCSSKRWRAGHDLHDEHPVQGEW